MNTRWIRNLRFARVFSCVLVLGMVVGLVAQGTMVALAQEEISEIETTDPTPSPTAASTSELKEEPSPVPSAEPSPEPETTPTPESEVLPESTPTVGEINLLAEMGVLATIAGGGQADPGEYPWQVALVRPGQNLYSGHFCGGVLVGPSHVLTTASCLEGVRTASGFEVVAGVHNLKKPYSGYQKRKVSMFYIHPEWDAESRQYDIAVIRLAKPLIIPRPGPAAADAILMPPEGIGNLVGVKGWSTGWGTLSSAPLSKPKYLQEIGLEFISDEECAQEKLWGQQFKTGMLCAWAGGGGEGTCVLDRGGPLVIHDGEKWLLAGVASWGDEPCGGGIHPSVFTRVEDYADWIEERVEHIPPAQPTLVEPKNNVMLNGYRIPFDWSEADGQKYQLEVWTHNTIKLTRVFNKIYTGTKVCGNGACRAVANKQLRGGEYTWRVRAQKGGVWGSWTNQVVFIVVNPAPVLLDPGCEVFNDKPTFAWSSVIGMTQYQVQVMRGSAVIVDRVVPANCDGDRCSFTPDVSLINGTYKWRVRAHNGGRWNAYSAFKSFIYLPSMTRVSLSSGGAQANGNSSHPTVSADGRIVAFESGASNLVVKDTNLRSDIFVRDRLTGATTRVSLAGSGTQGDGDSSHPSISADGRFVAFQSKAANLVAGDTNGFEDIFVHDRQTGITTRVSVGGDGAESNGNSSQAAISADGRFVAFTSQSGNLVSGDSNGKENVFVRDLAENTTNLVSVNKDGGVANHLSRAPAISADGRFIAFESMANDLVESDTNNFTDVFVRDMINQTTALVSVSSSGKQGDRISFAPSISDDGQKVAFISDSTNLVPADNNISSDAFVRDLDSNTTTRVSVASGGGQSEGGPVSRAVISADGGFVAFASRQNGLVAGDHNSDEDVFLHDCEEMTTTRVSISSGGAEGNADSVYPAISRFGMHVVFSAEAENLVLSDTNGKWDIFIYRR